MLQKIPNMLLRYSFFPQRLFRSFLGDADFEVIPLLPHEPVHQAVHRISFS
jgi:hypothetical protein